MSVQDDATTGACGNCRYWSFSSDTRGDCRIGRTAFLGPVSGIGRYGIPSGFSTVTGVWPVTDRNEWCGEHLFNDTRP